jgi:hypothetical protein
MNWCYVVWYINTNFWLESEPEHMAPHLRSHNLENFRFHKGLMNDADITPHEHQWGLHTIFISLHIWLGSRDSVVGIATRYGVEGPGIEFRWDEIFRTYPDRLWGPLSLLYSEYRDFPGVKVAGAWCLPHTPF